MAPAPNPGPPASLVSSSLASAGAYRLSAVAAPHVAALGLMLQTETDFGSRLSFLLSWSILNFFWIALLRRPALSGALSLTMVVVLVLLSRLKHDVAQMTANFVDLMVIDVDLPYIDGHSLLQAMHENGVAVPAIFISGLPGDDVEVRAFEVGAADFIRKPVKNSVLLARVAKVMKEVD